MRSRDVAVSDIGGVHESTEDEKNPVATARWELPREGRPWFDIREALLSRKSGDYDWRSGRVPLYIYHDSEELLAVAREAYNIYFTENALGARAFPSLARMESEVIQMCLSLFDAPQDADGSFTSGGTESIFLALKTARDFFVSIHPGTPRANVVIPRTAHPAFDKAAHYLGIDVVRVHVGSDLSVDVAALENAINDETMLICGSAPCYPYGVYDSIPLLGKIATSRRVWLHVDACLGGFLAPFAKEEGYPVPDFDFSTQGVTSLSADLHKHGFSAKGASVLLYRSGSLKAHQRFQFDNWPRGTYSTETFLGSRPGGAVASAWAVSQYLGRSGYRRIARKTMEAKDRLINGIEEIPELKVIHPSDLSIVLYQSVDKAVNINAVAESMSERGWYVGRSREPEAIHFALNAVHSPIIDRYLADLRGSVLQVRKSGRIGTQDNTTY